MNSPNNNRCLRLMIICVTVWFAGTVCSECQAQQRTWSDSSGSYSLVAELVKVSETEEGLQAELLMSDGKRMAIQISKLCVADQSIAKTWYEDSLKKTANSEAELKPIAEVKSEPKAEPAVKERAFSNEEEKIVSRPIGAPIEMAKKNLDNQNVTTLKFDPNTAIRLDREIARDDKGRPTENPVYKVEVSQRQLGFLPKKTQKIVAELIDPKVPIDVKRRAVESLKRDWPPGRHLGLLNVLINMLSDDDKYLRLAALDLLANHDSEQSLVYIFARIDDISFDVRWRTYEILTQLRDPRVIPELCERLDGADRTKIASVLQAFGATSAPWVHPWLENDKDEEVLLNACQLLGKIGETESLEVLEKVEGHKSFLVRAQTENSMKQIRQRIAERASNSPTRR